MNQQKRLFLFSLGLVAFIWGLLAQPIFASKSQYYDFGPYYNQSQVLGFSFSSLENLPAPKLPDNLNFQQATGLTPDSPFYPLDKIGENIQLAFVFDSIKKEELRLQFASERLSEARTLMAGGKTEAAVQALDDYRQAFKDVAKNLSDMSAKGDAGAKELADKVEETASSQQVIAQNLALTATPAQAEEWSAVVKVAGQTLDEVAEVKGESALPEDLSVSLQKFKEQGLISEEESNKIYGLGSRSEVRAELDKLASAGQFPAAELIKLDTAVAKNYPEVQEAMAANLQIAELRLYQTLPQPSAKTLEEMKKWQDNSAAAPPNEIKPYLWYNRASDLAKAVDFTNFSQEQQIEVAKFYPQSVNDNPTYQPTPSPSPSVSPSPSPTQTPTQTGSQAIDVSTASDSAAVDQNVSPTQTQPTPPQADPYLRESAGALPGENTYFIKQLGENFRLAITFDPIEKAKLKMQQAERRLAEAEALSTDPKRASLYEVALQEYKEAVGNASVYLKQAGNEQKAKEVAEKLESEAARHEVVFEKGLLPLPVGNPKLIADVIKTTEDVLDRSGDILGRPAMPPALASRLGDLKAQGLILEEEAEDLVKSNSREEVRGKIRKLIEQKTFPLADAKKMDDVQSMVSPSDYNQLVEVRKVEELQDLRATQADLAQTATLKSTVTTLAQKEASLSNSFDPTLIKTEDLGGRENLVKAYEKLSSLPRPINGGQFGTEATPGAQLVATPPTRRDAVLTTCPEGATFKQFEGCVWADSGKKINDYDQYTCDGPRQYYSFSAKKCVPYDPSKGWNNEDVQPICPVGYLWSWQTQSCQTSTGGIIPWPSPSPEPEPKDDQEREKRSKSCPEGASYKPPQGCVWDKDGKSVYDPEQYRCRGRGQYYSFKEGKCIPSPKEGEPYPEDSTPACKEPGTFWNWSSGKCLSPAQLQNQDQPGAEVINIDEFRPPFIAPNSPFYIIKQAAERVQLTLALTTPARGQVSLAQAKERLAEAADALKRDDQDSFKKSIDSYTAMMQGIVADVSKEQLNEGAKKEIGKLLSEEAVEQNLLLTKLQAWAPKEQDTAISAAVSVSILGVDKAADIAGEPPIPAEVKAKIESLPEKMISEEEKKKLLDIDSRVETRLKISGLLTNGALTQTDVSFLNEDFEKVDQNAKLKVEELKKLEELAISSENKEKLVEKVTKNEEVVQKLQEFEKTFEVGQEVPAEIRPYVRLTRINEVAQTIRPDIVKLEEFQNRKDVVLAVATLQEEFRPTKEAWKQVEDYRKKNPGAFLPPELARIEALSYSLGVRSEAGPCYLPTPPFAPNTPCPAPGAAIPIASYTNYVVDLADRDFPVYAGTPSTDKDGKPLVYGQGPKPEKAGICQDGYHWMYDSGGWCMSNSGNYSTSYNYAPTGPQTAGYTPYSPYYNAPGAPPSTFGYPAPDYTPNDGCPYGSDSDGRGKCISNSYPGSSYSYSPPSYYGTSPTYYTTNPPAGTVPGSGPKPTEPGKCPTGFHWMSDSGGWCMADGPTYVPSGGSYTSSYPAGTTTSSTPPTGGYNCGSQPYDPVTKKCKDGACPGGFDWDGSKCVARSSSGGGSTPWCWSAFPPAGGWTCESGSSWDQSACSCKSSSSTTSSGDGYSYSSPSSYQYGCTPGYFWDGNKCQKGTNEGSGWSDSAARSQSWCQPPSGGCGSGKYWDYGSCYCRNSSTYYGGGGPSPSNQCQGLSCGGGAWLDYSTCTCRYSGGSGTSSTGAPITCYPPSQGCPGGWYDYSTCSCKSSSYTSSGTTSGGAYCSPPAGGCGSGWWDSGSCSCKTASSQGCYNVSASSCGSGWYFDSAACTCRQSTSSSGSTTSSSGSTTSSSGSTSSGGSSSGSCPSGYHWMSENGGWCMSDEARSGSSTSSSGSTSTSSTSNPTTTTPPSSEPAPSTSTTTSSPPPSTTTESAPAPSTSTTTESAPAPSSSTESSPPPSSSTESSPAPAP